MVKLMSDESFFCISVMVALLTGWSESNVKVRAFRARQNLKRILQLSHDERR